MGERLPVLFCILLFYLFYLHRSRYLVANVLGRATDTLLNNRSTEEFFAATILFGITQNMRSTDDVFSFVGQARGHTPPWVGPAASPDRIGVFAQMETHAPAAVAPVSNRL